MVGRRHGNRFYPDLSAVARSWNAYPLPGCAPEDGVVELAVGLGRQIVDGGLSWTYCPAYPAAPPPFNSLGDRMRSTQTDFWAVNMGTPPPPDPMGETEFLLNPELAGAEEDDVLDHLVSTYHITIHDETFQGLSPEQQQVLLETAAEVTQWARAQAEAETEGLVQKMAEEGATIVQVDPAPFAEKALAGVEEMEEDGVWSAGLWQQIRDLTDEEVAKLTYYGLYAL